MNVRDRGVLVTGASRGIGRAIAREFATRGARVAIHYRQNREAAEETLASLDGKGHTLVQADLAVPEETRRLVHDAVSSLGRLQILVNNAGIWEEHRIASVDFEEWRSAWETTIATNLMGPANVTYWAVRHMLAMGSGGRIVNVSSRGAFRGEPDGPAYGASKAGLNAMSQSLAKALAPHGIYVTVVAPGFVATDMAAPFLDGPEGENIRSQSPMGRVARPEEVARTVLFLASEGSEFLTGTIVDVNGASYLRS